MIFPFFLSFFLSTSLPLFLTYALFTILSVYQASDRERATRNNYLRVIHWRMIIVQVLTRSYNYTHVITKCYNIQWGTTITSTEFTIITERWSIYRRNARAHGKCWELLHDNNEHRLARRKCTTLNRISHMYNILYYTRLTHWYTGQLEYWYCTHGSTSM